MAEPLKSRRNAIRILAAAVLAMPALLLAPAAGLTAESADETSIISAEEALKRSEEGELMIIDVRSPGEWRQTGIPRGAETVTIHNRSGVTGFMAELKETVGPDKDQPVAFICASGVRSSAAEQIMRGLGYTNIMNIREGMLGNAEDGPGWLETGLPTEPCQDC